MKITDQRKDEYGIIQPEVGDTVYCTSTNSCLYALAAVVVEVQRYGATLDYGEAGVPVPHQPGQTKRYWSMPFRELDYSAPVSAPLRLCVESERPSP